MDIVKQSRTTKPFVRFISPLVPPLMLLAMSSPASASLVINEFDYDQASTDSSEFIELINNGPSELSLTGYVLQLINGSGETPYATFTLPDATLNAGSYYVLCANSDTVPLCDQDLSPNTNLIQNGPDAITLLFGDTIVDTVSYKGDMGIYTEGSGSTLADNSGDYLGLSRYPDGMDSNWNSNDFSLRCITPGAANSIDASDCSAPTADAPSTVPIPPAFLLMASGLAGLFHFGRKKRRN